MRYLSCIGKNTKIQFYNAEKWGTGNPPTDGLQFSRRKGILTKVIINLSLQLSQNNAIRAHLPTPRNNFKTSKIWTASSILRLAATPTCLRRLLQDNCTAHLLLTRLQSAGQICFQVQTKHYAFSLYIIVTLRGMVMKPRKNSLS